ncbi:hypothetical protein [Nostoc sp.]|uniref:hypothetical protein n=1 Tax=Nostoc sp. TaxID=1180 RepID=UPI002FF6AA19
MTEILNDVLIIGQLEVEKLEYKPTSFNLVEHNRQSPEQIQVNLGYRRLIFFISQYKFVTCCIDEKFMTYILTNLFSNSIKFFSDDSILKLNLLNQNRQPLFKIPDWQIFILQKSILDLLKLFDCTINGVRILKNKLRWQFLKSV